MTANKLDLLKQIAEAQLRVGSTAFGGPLASMSMMRKELVERRKLVSGDRYLEGLALVKMLPGPVAVLLSVFLGTEIAGILGGILGVLCFVVPSFLMLLAICFFEDTLAGGFFHHPRFLAAMTGVQLVVLGVIFQSCFKLFKESFLKKYFGSTEHFWVSVFALSGAVAAFYRVSEIVILLSCGAGGLAWYFSKVRVGGVGTRSVFFVEPVMSAFSIFILFFNSGLTVFGTGYMILPVLQRILVEERAWLTAQEFLNAVAYGNLTPGPIVIASTYMGFKMGGFGSALAATVGIFLGPTLLMLFLGPVFRRYLGRPWLEGILLGVLPAVAATIAIGSFDLAKGFFTGDRMIVSLCAVGLSFYLIEWKKVSVIKLILAGAVVGGLIG